MKKKIMTALILIIFIAFTGLVFELYKHEDSMDLFKNDGESKSAVSGVIRCL